MIGNTPEEGKPRRGRRGLRAGKPDAGADRQGEPEAAGRGRHGFSLPKLGRALGADPTAVYRHFASKDDLVLAIADQLIEEAMAGLTPHECWVDTVTDTVRRLRQTYARHPAAASLSACRTTQRPAEMKIVDILIRAVFDAGFKGAEAARVYRAVGDFTLSWAGGEAAFLALDTRQQDTDRQAWTRAYRAAGRAELSEHLAAQGGTARRIRRRRFRDRAITGRRRAYSAGARPVRLWSARPSARGDHPRCSEPVDLSLAPDDQPIGQPARRVGDLFRPGGY